MSKQFDLVDVFHDGPFSGNPLAVVAATEDLGTETMKSMTRWFNLSETAFLLPPTNSRADYKVRSYLRRPAKQHPVFCLTISPQKTACFVLNFTPKNAQKLSTCRNRLVPRSGSKHLVSLH